MRVPSAGALLALPVLLVAPPASHATTYDVPPWGSIQSAIDFAAAGDTILVQCGTYVRGTHLLVDKQLVVLSETGEADCVQVVHDENAESHDGMRIVNAPAGTVIRGITIDGSVQNQTTGMVGIRVSDSEPTIENCRVKNWAGIGTGVLLFRSNATIEDCTITAGWLEHGGGIRVLNSSPEIRGCLLESCGVAGSAPEGGGIYLSGPAALVEDCTFRACQVSADNNPSTDYGGALWIQGAATVRGCVFESNRGERGAAIWSGGDVAIEDCTFTGGDSPHEGAAVNVGGGDVTMTGCEIFANEANEGAIAVTGGTVTVVDTRVTENVGKFSGGVYCSGGTLNLVGCTIADNVATSAGGIAGVKAGGGTVSLERCIVDDECGAKDVRVEAGTTISFECTLYDPSRLANASGTVNDLGNNFSSDPLFCDPAGCVARGVLGDYRLMENSPCLPANSPCGQLVGALGQGCAADAVEAATWAGIKIRYR